MDTRTLHNTNLSTESGQYAVQPEINVQFTNEPIAYSGDCIGDLLEKSQEIILEISIQIGQ